MRPVAPAVPLESLARRWLRQGRAWGDARYDPARRLLRGDGVAGRGGPPGGHLIRESLCFARVLLDAREEAETARAAEIADAVLETQIVREGSPAFGSFPRIAEDREEDVRDPSGACFMAQTILELLHRHRARLPRTTVANLERALERCALHDRRRWVSPASTHVALLSALSMAAGGDWLRDAALSRAGRAKLAEVAACADACGAFEEYHAPTCAAVSLRALASLLAFLADEPSRALAERLRWLQWRLLLDRAHPPTGQLAGPYVRAGGRDLLRHSGGLVKFPLHRALGQAFPLGTEADGTASDLFPALILQDPDCPDDLRQAFLRRGETWSVAEIVDSCSRSLPLPAFRRRSPPERASGSPEDWARLVESKGTPGRPAFSGFVQRTAAHLTRTWCLGSVSAEAMGDQAVPVIAHWPRTDTRDRANYLTVLVLSERDGALRYLSGGVLCCAQLEGRLLGLLRFGPDPETGERPANERVVLAFQWNADADAQVLGPGRPAGGSLRLDRGVVVRSHGTLVGFRTLKIAVPGAVSTAALRDLPAPHAHPAGESGVHLVLDSVTIRDGTAAFVAFALEIRDEGSEGGLAGLTDRLRDAKLDPERSDRDRVRLTWGPRLWLETSVLAQDLKGWLTPEGEVRARP